MNSNDHDAPHQSERRYQLINIHNILTGESQPDLSLPPIQFYYCSGYLSIIVRDPSPKDQDLIIFVPMNLCCLDLGFLLIYHHSYFFWGSNFLCRCWNLNSVVDFSRSALVFTYPIRYMAPYSNQMGTPFCNQFFWFQNYHHSQPRISFDAPIIY